MTPLNPERNWKNHPIHFLAFGLGSGAAPKAPGTFGTLAAMPFLFLFQFQYQSLLGLSAFIGLLIVSFVIGVYFCEVTSNDMGVHDHGGIVWDEFVGLWITFILVPLTWWTLILGFALFRFFDILKPWPIKWLDKKVEGGFGIMIDDVLAGIFALACMHGTLYFL